MTGVSDPRFGDGRAPAEANWNHEAFEEKRKTDEQMQLNFLVRRRPRSSEKEPRVGPALVQQLHWMQANRRTVLEQNHRPPPVPGTVQLLAPHYRDGMEQIYRQMRKVIRFVEPPPIAAEDLGSADFAQECMYVSVCMYTQCIKLGGGASPRHHGAQVRGVFGGPIMVFLVWSLKLPIFVSGVRPESLRALPPGSMRFRSGSNWRPSAC